MRQYRLGNLDGPKDIRIELPQPILILQILPQPNLDISSIVEKHVNTTMNRNGCRDDGVDVLLRPGEVELQHVGALCGQVLDGRGFAGRGDDEVAASEDGGGEGEAEAGGAAGDEPDERHGVRKLEGWGRAGGGRMEGIERCQ